MTDRLKHVGVSSIRIYTASRLREMKAPEIICNRSEPIAAIVPYQLYVLWQKLIQDVTEATEATEA